MYVWVGGWAGGVSEKGVFLCFCVSVSVSVSLSVGGWVGGCQAFVRE